MPNDRPGKIATDTTRLAQLLVIIFLQSHSRVAWPGSDTVSVPVMQRNRCRALYLGLRYSGDRLTDRQLCEN